MAFRSGLEDMGIGGGTPAADWGLGLGDGRFCGTGGGSVGLLLKPMSSADLRGAGATNLFVRGVVALLVGVRIGRGGRSGDRSWVADCLGGSDGRAGSSGVLDIVGGSVRLET